ncbi:hypothetical protein [Buchananella hordeovulneris]|uniref:hypothetical protein n=1 Tax=Buchananella hordeovulneris TaxID=52770 RepID=UPI0026DAD7F9|nr:hypothetical protein [Buchananella hordeovulneris]MDO5080979.1 hypothetical protein [Buchananella hordeovulneris]
MTPWIGVLAFVLVVVAWRLISVARRVDRQHVKVLGLRATLEVALLRRAQAANDLATSQLLDSASSLLLAAAAADCFAAAEAAEGLPGRSAAGPDRSTVESELSAVLAEVLDSETRRSLANSLAGQRLVEQLDKSCYRLTLARQFHNDAVAEVRLLRSRAWVRAFRLAGRAQLPEPFDMNEEGR